MYNMKELQIEDVLLRHMECSADTLSKILKRKVLLTIPDYIILEKEDKLPEQLKFIKGSIMITSIAFEDSLRGKANLIFPSDKTREFVDICLRENKVDLDGFDDLDADVLREVGNIVLNAIIGSINNFLGITVNYTVPVIDQLDSYHKRKVEGMSIILFVSFLIEDVEIDGAIIIDLSLESYGKLMESIKLISI